MADRRPRTSRFGLLVALTPLALGGLVVLGVSAPSHAVHRPAPRPRLVASEALVRGAEDLPTSAPVRREEHSHVHATPEVVPTASEDALLRSLEDLLRSESEEAFEGGRAEQEWLTAASGEVRLSGAAILRLLDLLDAQRTPARRSFLAFALRVGTEVGRLGGSSPTERRTLVARLADEVLRERDGRVGRILIGALRYVGWEEGEARDGLDTLARVVAEPGRSAEERDEAAGALAEAASLGDGPSLDAIRRMTASSDAASAASALDALAAVAGGRLGDDALRRQVVSALEAIPADAIPGHWRAIERLAPTLASSPSRFRQALLGGSLVERSIAVAALSGRQEALDADEREALFRIAEGDGPAWMRAEALDRLLTQADDAAAGERLARLAAAISTSAPDETLRQRAETVAAMLPAMAVGEVE